MKKKLYFILIIFFVIEYVGLSSELIYIDSIENNQIQVNRNSLFVHDGITYFYNFDNGFYSINQGNLYRHYESQLSNLIPENFYCYVKMTDTSNIYFVYGQGEFNNGVVLKKNGFWTVLNSTNSELNDVAPIYDIIFGENSEALIINTTNKLGFFKDGILNNLDCGMNYDCMPQPFSHKIGTYFQGCYYYSNSRYNMSVNCNRSLTKTINKSDLGIDSLAESRMMNFTVHNNKLWFSNDILNLFYSFDGDKIESFSLLTEEQNKELRFNTNIPLHLNEFIFGNDGYLYVMFRQITASGTTGLASQTRVIKMDMDFNIIEVLPIPMTGMISPYITHFTKDESDLTNKKVYIGASRGFYIYDPEPTSVIDDKETGPGTLFLMDIYPNPASGNLNIKYGADISNSNKIRMFVTNIMGRRVKEYNKINSYDISTGYGNAKLDISDLVSGNYLLVITDGYNYATKNILIIK